ncbi:PDZ domain-containing protein [Nitrogeniibacter mangrovi]|uniref:PDZ domain-containing protein n=1 Tax=Nitrogeniibacter mangrovi TaxID=2016596 RepID=A0A6C1B3W2_9RHOO|nr:ChaN family lipoprotein [Nitrogeniibacter mangrovi]QID18352.1 PDZ domain-containing protein [Nitrogeniibacter mangrovi]
MWLNTLLTPLLIGLALVAPAAQADTAPPADIDPPVLAVGQAPTLQQTLENLKDDRIVFVGETHTRYDHHLVQLETLKFLHRKYGEVALGVEWFQFPFQSVLDDYVAGRIDEAQMLARSGYFDRWRFDYRLYRPILRYARDNGIAIVALNAPAELTRKIGQGGLKSLSAAERARLPATYGPASAAYRERVRTAFEAHPRQDQGFEDFFEVMQTWDETMAKTASDYVKAHPGRHLLVLAGSGHVMFGDGIPDRVERRTGIRGARLLVGAEHLEQPHVADFVVLSEARTLPPAGQLGVFLNSADARVIVQGLAEDSVLKPLGVVKGDVIVAIDDTPTPDFAGLKLALLDRAPGDEIRMRYRHDDRGVSTEATVAVRLGGAQPPAHP